MGLPVLAAQVNTQRARQALHKTLVSGRAHLSSIQIGGSATDTKHARGGGGGGGGKGKVVVC